MVRTVAGILVRTVAVILLQTVAGILVRTVADILVQTVAGILVQTVAGIPSVLHTRKFRCALLFAMCRIAHRHVVMCTDIHSVFSPFTARQFPLLATSHLSSLIISCAAQLWTLLLYIDIPFNAYVRAYSLSLSTAGFTIV